VHHTVKGTDGYEREEAAARDDGQVMAKRAGPALSSARLFLPLSPILDSTDPGAGWGTTNRTRGERATLRGDLTKARDTSARQDRRRVLFVRFPQ
jgi:hypothetical protein